MTVFAHKTFHNSFSLQLFPPLVKRFTPYALKNKRFLRLLRTKYCRYARDEGQTLVQLREYLFFRARSQARQKFVVESLLAPLFASRFHSFQIVVEFGVSHSRFPLPFYFMLALYHIKLDSFRHI